MKGNEETDSLLLSASIKMNNGCCHWASLTDSVCITCSHTLQLNNKQNYNGICTKYSVSILLKHKTSTSIGTAFNRRQKHLNE